LSPFFFQIENGTAVDVTATNGYISDDDDKDEQPDQERVETAGETAPHSHLLMVTVIKLFEWP
jgi:hypothetical protein